MQSSTLTRAVAFTALSISSIAFANAQEGKVRTKVKMNFDAPADETVGIAKMVRGDAGSIVLLKTKEGRTVLGGVPQAQLDWSLHAMATEGLTEIKSDKPKIVWGEGDVALETIETFNKQFRMIATKPDPENAKLIVLQQILSPRSLTGKAAQLLTEIPYDRLGKGPDYFKANTAIGFTTTISVDSSKMLLGLTPASTTRSAGCPIYAMVFDKQNKVLWYNTLTTDANAKRIDILATKVDKAGAVWYLIRNVTDTDPKLKEVLGYSYTLYRLDSAGQTEATLDMGKKEFAQQAAFDIRPDGTIVCGGIWSNSDAARNESVGIFSTTLDAVNMKWNTVAKAPYDKQTVKKEERLQTNMKLEHIWPKTNGGMYVVTQRAGVETHTVSDLSGKKVEKSEWVNGPFHIMELTPAGEPKWYKHIDRDMGYDNDGPGKPFSLCFGDVLFLFYNDVEANFENRKSKLPVQVLSSAKDAVMLEFKPDGGDKGKVMLQEKFDHAYFNPSSIWYLSNGLVGTTATSGFGGKPKNWPVLIEMSNETKK